MIKKRGTAIPIGGSILVLKIQNKISFFRFISNLDRAYAAGTPSMRLNAEEIVAAMILFFNARGKTLSGLRASLKFCNVGLKMKTGGLAKVRSLVLNAVNVTQKIGKRNTIMIINIDTMLTNSYIILRVLRTLILTPFAPLP
jgi:hypothetical protein